MPVKAAGELGEFTNMGAPLCRKLTTNHGSRPLPSQYRVGALRQCQCACHRGVGDFGVAVT
eukprot:745114-Rhodomonas_salina.1